MKNKQHSRLFLLMGAAIIVVLTLWFSSEVGRTLRREEQLKVALWSEAIVQRAQLVGYTEQLFQSLRVEESDKAKLMAEAYKMIQKADPGEPVELSFVTKFIQSNRTIPVLVYKDSVLQMDVNVPPDMHSPLQLDSLREVLLDRGSVIHFGEGLSLLYDESNRFRDLQQVMDDIIKSFISETVLNSASIPVLLTDSSFTHIIRADRFAAEDLADTTALIASLLEVNAPIALDLPDVGKQWVLYDESLVLKQLRFFPLVQLMIIGVFLILAYSSLNAFRRSEQNRVWVGMAKETAHQLGTPLSALMAWVEVLRSEGVDESVLSELEKDLDRLRTVTDRFSKIGSDPELASGDLSSFVLETMAYLELRMPKAVAFEMDVASEGVRVAFNPALFGWVLENLTKNAVDAMEGSGRLKLTLITQQGEAVIHVDDTGKGMPKRVRRQAFDPGFSTKTRGWGLGLSLVRRIVRDYHGGQISITRSEEGKGTTFRIALPLVSEELG